MKRKNGLYLVNHHSKWKIAEYFDGYWKIHDNDLVYCDNDFNQINEKVINTKTYK